MLAVLPFHVRRKFRDWELFCSNFSRSVTVKSSGTPIRQFRESSRKCNRSGTFKNSGNRNFFVPIFPGPLPSKVPGFLLGFFKSSGKCNRSGTFREFQKFWEKFRIISKVPVFGTSFGKLEHWMLVTPGLFPATAEEGKISSNPLTVRESVLKSEIYILFRHEIIFSFNWTKEQNWIKIWEQNRYFYSKQRKNLLFPQRGTWEKSPSSHQVLTWEIRKI